MVQVPVKKFSIDGDTNLMPHRAPNFQINMWGGWGQSIPKLFIDAEPYVEATEPSDRLMAVCRMERDMLHFVVFDLDQDINAPRLMACDIRILDLGKDDFASYVDLRRDTVADWAKQNTMRMEAHNKLVGTVLNHLKEAGLHFEIDYSAEDLFRKLTAYWFDLLDSTGKLDLRSARSTRRGFDEDAAPSV